LIPTLSCMSVSLGPVDRLRHWCSSRYLRISPLHLEFHQPLPNSRSAVSKAVSQLSCEISPLTYQSACAPFTPSESGQRLLPTYYRGCWHVVSRSLLSRYLQTHRMGLYSLATAVYNPKGLHPARGVAASDFRPLRNIPYCCLP
jgi:hypothetical protein